MELSLRLVGVVGLLLVSEFFRELDVLPAEFELLEAVFVKKVDTHGVTGLLRSVS